MGVQGGGRSLSSAARMFHACFATPDRAPGWQARSSAASPDRWSASSPLPNGVGHLTSRALVASRDETS